MTFFPPDPDLTEPEESEEPESTQPQWLAAPEDVLPALLPVTEVIAVTEHVAVALVSVAVYQEGVEFRVERRLRRNGLPMKKWHELSANFMEHVPWGDMGTSGERLRFGLVLGDGQQVLGDHASANWIDPSEAPAAEAAEAHTSTPAGMSCGCGPLPHQVRSSS